MATTAADRRNSRLKGNGVGGPNRLRLFMDQRERITMPVIALSSPEKKAAAPHFSVRLAPVVRSRNLKYLCPRTDSFPHCKRSCPTSKFHLPGPAPSPVVRIHPPASLRSFQWMARLKSSARLRGRERLSGESHASSSWSKSRAKQPETIVLLKGGQLSQ